VCERTEADGQPTIVRAVKTAARSLLRRLGVEAVRYAPRNFPHLRRMGLIAEERIDLVVDAGAGDGAWASALRAAGYGGRMVSFEPLEASFVRLQRTAASDALWEVRRLALAATNGNSAIHVSANEQSSSLLVMAPLHLLHAPESAVVADEEVPLERLDGVDLGDSTSIYLKVDVQGTELEVFRGAASTLLSTRVVEAELSAVELYEGQPLIEEVVAHLRGEGFDLIGLEPSFRDRQSGDLLQANGLFRRRE
jgi:FkbM family methyltransferase